MTTPNLIPPLSPNIIDGKDNYIYYDIEDEYSPLSLPEVIQAPSSDPVISNPRDDYEWDALFVP